MVYPMRLPSWPGRTLDAQCRLMSVPGHWRGPIISSAMVAAIGTEARPFAQRP